jgi:hypothetical protein
MQAFRTFRETRGSEKSGYPVGEIAPYDDSWVGDRKLFVTQLEIGHRAGSWYDPRGGLTAETLCKCFDCRISAGE